MILLSGTYSLFFHSLNFKFSNNKIGFFTFFQGYGSWKTQKIDHRTPWTGHEHYYSPDSRLSVGGFHTSSNSKSISEGTYSFIHLSPDTEYEVKIRAKNAYGWSEDEPAFVFKTSNKGQFCLLFFQ